MHLSDDKTSLKSSRIDGEKIWEPSGMINALLSKNFTIDVVSVYGIEATISKIFKSGYSLWR